MLQRWSISFGVLKFWDNGDTPTSTLLASHGPLSNGSKRSSSAICRMAPATRRQRCLVKSVFVWNRMPQGIPCRQPQVDMARFGDVWCENEESDHKLLDRFGYGPAAPQQHGTLEPRSPFQLTTRLYTLRNCQDMAADFGFSPGHHSCYQLSILYYIYIILYIYCTKCRHIICISCYTYIHVSYTYSQDRYDPSRST